MKNFIYVLCCKIQIGKSTSTMCVSYSVKKNRHQSSSIRSYRLLLGEVRTELLHLVEVDAVPDQAVGEEVPSALQTPNRLKRWQYTVLCTHNIYETTGQTARGIYSTLRYHAKTNRLHKMSSFFK